LSFASFVKDFDKGMHQASLAWTDTGQPEGKKCMSYQFAAAMARKEGFYPEAKELEKRQEHYLKKLKVPEWAENRAARVRSYAEDTWFLQKYFEEAPKLKGGEPIHINSPISEHEPDVMKAFQVVPAELTVFPFFWDTQIVEGILAVPLLDVLLMDTVTVASGTAVHAVMNETLADRQMGETGEFASFQEVNITSNESAVKLKKFGGIVSISDEAMRRQRIPVFARGIARIGRQIGIDMTDLCIDVLINGDTTYGGINGAATTVAATSTGNPVYSDYVKNDLDFNIGYEPTDRILTRAGIIKTLNIAQFQDPLAGFKFQNQGIYPEIFGLMTHRWDSTGSTSWSTTVGTGTKMLTVQRQRALILYQEGGLSTESDRDPRTETTIVKTSWYLIPAIWDRDSVRVGTGFA
jgi:hypothetical protein